MSINPIYRKESLITWKSMKLVLLISAFNLGLLIYYISRMNLEFNNIINTMKIDYQEILALFKQVIIIDYFLIILVTPAIAASSISGERERQSLELVLSTTMSPMDIVFGKLFSHLSNMSIFIISSLPIFSLVYVYGGVSFIDLGIIFITYICTIYFIVSIGIFSSSISKKTNIASVLSYIVIALIFFVSLIFTNGIERTFDIDINISHNAGVLMKYIILFNPLSIFYMALARISNNGVYLNNIFFNLANIMEYSNSVMCIFVGVFLQIMLGNIFIFIAIRKIDPRHKR